MWLSTLSRCLDGCHQPASTTALTWPWPLSTSTGKCRRIYGGWGTWGSISADCCKIGKLRRHSHSGAVLGDVFEFDQAKKIAARLALHYLWIASSHRAPVSFYDLQIAYPLLCKSFLAMRTNQSQKKRKRTSFGFGTECCAGVEVAMESYFSLPHSLSCSFFLTSPFFLCLFILPFVLSFQPLPPTLDANVLFLWYINMCVSAQYIDHVRFLILLLSPFIRAILYIIIPTSHLARYISKYIDLSLCPRSRL